MFLVSLLPGSLLDSLSLYFSAYSKDHNESRFFPKQKILDSIQVWADTLVCKHAIVGHFHYPFDEPRTSGGGRIMSVESWDRPNLLLYDGTSFKRFFKP